MSSPVMRCRCGHLKEEHATDEGECLHTEEAVGRMGGCVCQYFSAGRAPIRGARLNVNYCLVKLTYLQAQQLFLAADPMRDDDAKNIGWTKAQMKALREGLDKLRETAERWPQGMDA